VKWPAKEVGVGGIAAEEGEATGSFWVFFQTDPTFKLESNGSDQTVV
jgi:hypothetical protein